jgi:hypothetical protein
MAKGTYNFEESRALAINSPRLILNGFGLSALKTEIYTLSANTQEGDTPIKSSYYLGTPVFANIDFIGGTYINMAGEAIEYLGGENGGFAIDSVLVSVGQSKNIVTTAIQGRNGTVKEYISDGDYKITIRGVLTSATNRNGDYYPVEEVKKLMEICKVNASVKIASRFLNDIFGVYNIVIESYVFPQEEGQYNTQLFSIDCISDDPIELTIQQDSF